MTVHDKAIRLLEGGVVEINGNWFRLLQYETDVEVDACNECTLDSICRMEHVDVCAECESISKRNCCLRLAHTGR